MSILNSEILLRASLDRDKYRSRLLIFIDAEGIRKRRRKKHDKFLDSTHIQYT